MDRNKPDARLGNILMNRVRVMHLICCSDFKQHGTLVSDLYRTLDLGRKEWLSPQTSSFKLLVKCNNLNITYNQSTSDQGSRDHLCPGPTAWPSSLGPTL
eukprot:4335745-Ditylum_brightwellii.AAC.1